MALFKSSKKADFNNGKPLISTGSVLGDVFVTCRSAITATFLFSFAANLFVFVLPIFMTQVYDRVLNSRSGMTLAMITLVCVFALVIQGLIEAARSYIFIYVSTWLDQKLGRILLSNAVVSALERGRGGDIEAIRDLDKVRQFLTGSSMYNLLDAPWVPVFMGFLFFLNFWLGVVAVIGALLLFALAYINDVSTNQALRKAGAATARSNRAAESMVRNAEVVEALGMRQTLLSRWSAETERSQIMQENASRKGAVISELSKIGRLVIQMAITVVAVLEMISPDSTLTPGAMLASIILVGRALAPLEMAIGNWRQMVQAKQSYENIKKALEKAENRLQSSVSLPRPQGHLAVEKVTFVVPGTDRFILNRVSFEVKPGSAVGIVGPSASGKSTLARMMVGVMRPSSGAIRLDGADVFSWSSDELGQYVGYVPQDVELFEGTIAENISRFTKANSDEVIEAAQLAGLHEMILRMPQGYDTQIGSGGAMLSGGQRQRVALARALFRRPSILVLDEPNASLDAAGEQALVEAIKRVKEMGTSVVIIAHRPSVMVVADTIVVLVGGVVSRVGTRDEIMPQIAGPQTNVHPLPNRAGGGAQPA